MRCLFTLVLVATNLVSLSVWAQSAIPKHHIYPEPSAAHMDIDNAVAAARHDHKRIILDFGGDWCGDCQVLDIYFHQNPNLSLLEQNFVLVHVNVGRIDENLDLGTKYGVVLEKGVPALAVLDERGKPIYGQSGGEFENMRKMDPNSVTDFLEKWKPKR